MEDPENFIESEIIRLQARNERQKDTQKAMQRDALTKCKWNLRLWAEFLEGLSDLPHLCRQNDLIEPDLIQTEKPALLNFYPGIQV